MNSQAFCSKYKYWKNRYRMREYIMIEYAINGDTEVVIFYCILFRHSNFKVHSIIYSIHCTYLG